MDAYLGAKKRGWILLKKARKAYHIESPGSIPLIGGREKRQFFGSLPLGLECVFSRGKGGIPYLCREMSLSFMALMNDCGWFP